jgi:hypothetical protein
MLDKIKAKSEECLNTFLYCELFWICLRISQVGLQWPLALAIITIKFKWWLMFDPLWDRFRECEAWCSGFNVGVAVGAAIATTAIYYRNR